MVRMAMVYAWYGCFFCVPQVRNGNSVTILGICAIPADQVDDPAATAAAAAANTKAAATGLVGGGNQQIWEQLAFSGTIVNAVQLDHSNFGMFGSLCVFLLVFMRHCFLLINRQFLKRK
jgi:hypothetical protein